MAFRSLRHIASALLVLLFLATGATAAVQVRVTPATATGAIGSTVTVKVEADSATALGGFQFGFGYSTTDLQVVSATVNPAFDQTIALDLGAVTGSGMIAATVYNNPPLTGTPITLATIDFKILTSSTGNITLAKVILGQTGGAEIASTAVGGTIGGIGTHTVTFNANGGSAVSNQIVPHNGTATTPAAPTKTGSTFAGWYSDYAMTVAFVFTTPITADITLYAKWTLNSYTISFASGGNGSLAGTTRQTVSYGGNTTAVTAKPDGAYLFRNWVGTNGFVTTSANPLIISNVSASFAIAANFASTPINGICGGDDGKAITGTPVNLCYQGSSPVVSGSGPWSWICNGTAGGANSRLCSATLKTWSVTASASAGGSISPTGIVTVNHNTTKTFTLAADPGYNFVNITGTCPAGSGNSVGYTTGAVTADCTVIANYAGSPNTVISNSAPASDSFINTGRVGYTLSENVTSGSITFTRSGGAADVSSPRIYTFISSDMTVGSHTINSIALQNGTVYTITINANDAAGNPTTTVTITNVTYDTSGAVVTLDTPAPGARTNSVSVIYSAGEQLGSATITATRTGGTADPASYSYTLSTEELTSGSHTVNTGFALVNDAIYSITITNITDQAGNPTSDVSVTGITFDDTALPISLTSPATGSSTITTQADITLGEEAQAASITFTNTGGTVDYASPHTYTITGDDLLAGSRTIATGLPLVNDAIYSISLAATDLAENPATTVTVTNVAYNDQFTLTVQKDGTGTGTVTAPAGLGNAIICGATCYEAYTPGTSVTLTAMADTGANLSGWTGCDSTSTDQCTATVGSAKNITATFNKNIYSINFASGGNGTLAGTTSQTVNYGDSATAVTANPDSGYSFLNWTGTIGFVTTSANPLTITNVSAPFDVTANFASTPIAGICGGDDGQVITDTPVNLCYQGTSSAVSGSGPWSWICSGIAGGVNSPLCSAAMKTWTITASATTGGSISPTGSVTVNYNTTQTFTLVADAGYNLINITGTCPAGNGETTGYTTGTVIADCTITANYADITPPVISNSAPASDSFINTGQVGYTLSEDVTSGSITFTRSGGAEDVSSPLGYTFVTADMTAGSHTISGIALQNGTLYTITFDAVDAAGNPATTVTVTNVTYDTSGAVVTLDTPAPGSRTNSVSVIYSAGEQLGSATITATRTGGTADPASYSYNLSAGELTSGSHTVNTGFALVNNAIYSITITNIIDQAGNPTSDVSVTGITFDDTALPISLTSPATGSSTITTQTGFTLGEDALSGRITFTRTGGTVDYASPHTYTITGADLLAGSRTITTALPLVNGTIYSISLAATDLAGNPATTVTVTNITYNDRFTLTVQKDGAGTGTVTAPAGLGSAIICGATCYEAYTPGTSVTLTAMADTGATLSGWTGCDSTSANYCTVTVGGAKNIKATFNQNSYTVSFNSNGGSLVSSQIVVYNRTATLPTAPTNSGSTFAGWHSDVSLTIPFVFTNAITANTTLYAKWATTTDSTGPTLIVSTLANGSITNNATLNISGTVSDSESGVKSVAVNGNPITITSGGFAIAIAMTDGANTITAIATDNSYNSTIDRRTITLDRTAPGLTINLPVDNSLTDKASVEVTGGLDDATATITAKINNTSAICVTMNGNNFSVTLNLEPGLNTIEISASDLAGNSSSAKRTITSDTSVPALAVTLPAQDISTTESSVTIIGNVTENVTSATVSITVDGQTFTPTVATNGSFSQNITLATDKTFAVIVTATDQAGNKATVQRNIIKSSIIASGDITGDGVVDISDALRVLKIALGNETATKDDYAKADVAPLKYGKPNPDGVIDIADATVILMKAVGLLSW